MRFVLQISVVLLAAYSIIYIINNTQRRDNREAIWFFYTAIILGSAILILKLFTVFQVGVRINIMIIVKFLLLVMGLISQGVSIFQLFCIAQRKGMVNQRIGGVILLNVATIIVILGLYYIR